MNSSPLNSLTSAAIYCSSNLHTHLQSICHIFSYNLRFTYSMLFLYSIIYFILVFPIIFRQSVLSWLIIFYTFFYSLSSGHSIHQKIGRRLIFRHSQSIYIYTVTPFASPANIAAISGLFSTLISASASIPSGTSIFFFPVSGRFISGFRFSFL